MAPGAAEANSILQNATYGPSVTDWTNTFTFNQFDPALGILTKVIITSQESLTTSGTVKNTASVTETFNFQAVFQANLTLANGTVQVSSAALPTMLYTLASGASAAYGPYSGQAGSLASTTYTLPADMALYEGIGTLNFTGMTSTGESVTGGGGNITATLATTALDAVTVEYDYTPGNTPEPLSLALSGTGLALIGLFGWKRAAHRGRQAG